MPKIKSMHSSTDSHETLAKSLIICEVATFRKKLAGLGGKDMVPSEKRAEANLALCNILKIAETHRKDSFLATQHYREILQFFNVVIQNIDASLSILNKYSRRNPW